MAARNNIFAVLILLAINACASAPSVGKLMELRQLPESERMIAFSQLSEEGKVELFFQANRRHPPYTGLNDAFGEDGKALLMRIREELDKRGGVPEVLSFMGIVFDLKNQNVLSSGDISDLRVKGICRLAKQSQYCPELEAKLLAP